MRQSPLFWQKQQTGWQSLLLSPLAWGVKLIAAGKERQRSFKAPVPVLCCGNITTGGTGKTTVVIDLAVRLKNKNITPHILLRGYGGKLKGPVQVDLTRHTAEDVGDEALLLAAVSPTWIGGNRALSARAAVARGAQCLIMDDGFQNFTLHKDFSLLIIDGAAGLGNGQVLPAGPLRESPQRALSRASAIMIIGEDKTGFLSRYAGSFPPEKIIQAGLQTCFADSNALRDKNCIAFAGIGRPGKFFDSLAKAGITLVKTISFADHHFYKTSELECLQVLASEHQAQLVTTPKDYARLPEFFRSVVSVTDVELVWQDDAVPEKILHTLMPETGL